MDSGNSSATAALTKTGKATVDDHDTANTRRLALLTDVGTEGSLCLYTQQRRLINAIIKDEIGTNDTERASAREIMWQTVLAWLNSGDRVVVERGMRSYWRMEANRITALNSVTDAVDAERRAMAELIKAATASSPSDVGVQTIADAVAVAKAALEQRKQGSNAT